MKRVKNVTIFLKNKNYRKFTTIAGTINVNYALYGVLGLSAIVFTVTLIVMIKVNKTKQAEIA